MKTNKTSLEPLYSVTEAAKMLGGVSKFTIYAWMNRGLIERTRIGGRVMLRETSLINFIERCNSGDNRLTSRALIGSLED